jgi:hypothetical protein
MAQQQRVNARFRIIMRVVVALLVGAVVSLGVLWKLSSMTPSWYQPLPVDRETRDLAGQVEYFLVEEAHEIRPADHTWTLRLSAQQINAWLVARLPQWIEHEQDLDWPTALGPPQVRLTSEGIDVAARLQLDPHGTERVVVARIVPTVHDDGISLSLQRLGAGLLQLPGDPAALINEQLLELRHDEIIDQDVSRFLHDLVAGRGVLDREIKLADNRVIRVVAVHCREGSLDVVLQTRSPGIAAGDAGMPRARSIEADHR